MIQVKTSYITFEAKRQEWITVYETFGGKYFTYHFNGMKEITREEFNKLKEGHDN